MSPFTVVSCSLGEARYIFGIRFSAAVDDKAQNHERRDELAARLAGNETSLSRVDDACAPVVEAMTGLGMEIDGIFLWMDAVMHKLQKALAALVKAGPRAICEDHIKLSVTDFTASPVRAPAAADSSSLPTSDVDSARVGTHTDPDVVPSEAVPSPAEAGGVSAIERTMADFLGDVSLFHSSESHA